MSDKYLQEAAQLDTTLKFEKFKNQKFDTKVKNADRIKAETVSSDPSMIGARGLRIDIENEQREKEMEITRNNMKQQMMMKL